MNNQVFLDNENKKEENEMGAALEVRMAEDQKLLMVLDNLEKDPNFQSYLKTVINPSIEIFNSRIETGMKKLKDDADGKITRNVIYDSGYRDALVKFSVLTKQKELLKAEIKGLRNATKE